jgi:hypothetical protein
MTFIPTDEDQGAEEDAEKRGGTSEGRGKEQTDRQILEGLGLLETGEGDGEFTGDIRITYRGHSIIRRWKVASR